MGSKQIVVSGLAVGEQCQKAFRPLNEGQASRNRSGLPAFGLAGGDNFNAHGKKVRFGYVAFGFGQA